jgi:hypothetical protein
MVQKISYCVGVGCDAQPIYANHFLEVTDVPKGFHYQDSRSISGFNKTRYNRRTK